MNRQTHTCLGSSLGWAQIWWVRRFAKPMYVWARRLVELKEGGVGGSPDPYKSGLSAWLSLKTVGLAVRQTYTYMCLVFG